MQTINDRINIFMDEYDVSISDMARKIGVSKPAISMICSGQHNPSKQTINLISQYYGVSLAWLTTGIGEMKSVKSKTDEISKITATLFSESEDSFRYRFIKLIASLTDEQLNTLKEIVDLYSAM